MLGVADLELEVVNVNLDIGDAEDGALGGSGLEGDLSADALAGDDDIGDTRVLEFGESALLLEVERDISQIGLDLAEAKSKSMFLVVAHRPVRRQLEIVPVLNLDEIGQQVRDLDVEVLDDNVELVVGVLCSGDGQVADLRCDSGDNDVAQVVDEVRLVLEVSVAVKGKVLDELLDVDAKLLVERVLVVGKEELLDRVELLGWARRNQY